MSSAAMPRIFVGIPAFNEAGSIAAVVEGALPHAATVVVVDDGSSDLTALQALRAGATVIRHAANGGKGAAVDSLFRYAVARGADALVLIDGDGQHNPAEIPTVAAPVLTGDADLVVGSRYLTVRGYVPFHRQVGQHAFNTMTALASGVACTDSQSGFRAFGRRALCAMRIMESSFSVECEQQFEVRAHGLRLAEVPISCSYAVPEKRSAYRQGLQVLSRLCAMALRRRLLGQPPLAAARPASTVSHPIWETEPAVALAAD